MVTRWGVSRAFLFLALFIFFFSSAQAIGMGISTQTVYFKDILRGGYAESIITASNPNGYAVVLGVQIIGDVAPWIKLDPEPPNIIIPARSNGDFKIIMQPPPFVQNGVYTGQIVVLSGPDPNAVTSGTGSAVVAGAAVDIFIEVSDNQIKNMSMRKIIVDPTEECWPITFRMSIKNEGNVENTPTCGVKLYTKDRTIIVKETDKNFGSILPTVTKTDFIQLDYHWEQLKCIEKGDYVADVSCAASDGSNFYSSSIPVQIAPKDTLKVAGELVNVTHIKKAFLGEPIKITGNFKNVGVVSGRASLKVEAYKGERLVGVIKGDEVIAEPDKETQVTAFFTPTELGEYKLVGSVAFADKSTNIVESSLVVELGMTMLLIIIAVPLLVIVAVAVILYRRTKSW